MSPPSTTSSTDSEESESDNELKTPLDDKKTSTNDRWAAALSTGGRWRKPKREWVWTLGGGDDRDVKEELEYSGVKVWGEELMAV